MAGLRLACGVLAVVAAAACASAPEPSSSAAPAAPPSVSPVEPSVPPATPSVAPVTSWVLPTAPAAPVMSSLAPTAIVECDVAPLGEAAGSGDNTATVRFVAYGDVGRGSGCAMAPDVRLAVVVGYDDIIGWWELIGDDLGIFEQAPPGLQIPVSGEDLSAAPAFFVTTGPDGTAEADIAGMRVFDTEMSVICAMSPISEDLIAGCSHERIRLEDGDVVYVYFSHGHAIVETGPQGTERYERFLDGEDISNQPMATVYLVSITHYDYGPPRHLVPGVQVAVIEDAYVDAWWSEISKGERVYLDVFGVYLDPEVLRDERVHIIKTGSAGVARIALPPGGDYLFCVSGTGCDHEDISGSYDHVIEIDVSSGEAGPGGVRMLTEGQGRSLLEHAKTMPIA